MTYKLTRTSGRDITDNEILDDIKRVNCIVKNNSFLSKKQFSEHSFISVNTAINRFGSWHNALTKAGLANKSIGEIPSKKLSSPQSRIITNTEIIAELKRVADELGKKCITRSEFDNSSTNMSSSTVTTRFGSWEIGLNKAFLELSPTARRYSEQECFENILNVWEYHGKQPTKDMMSEPPSRIRAGTYKLRWGSWFNALKAFVESASISSGYTEEDEPENKKECIVENNNPSEVIPNPKRSIGWRLRYQILNRDKFKCVLCGDSPATNNICKLHVDHIFHFVKGGKTDISNLRTLCHVCNIGKGDTTFEYP